MQNDETAETDKAACPELRRRGVGFFVDPEDDENGFDMRFTHADGVFHLSVDRNGGFCAYVFDRRTSEITQEWEGTFGSIPIETIARYVRPDMTVMSRDDGTGWGGRWEDGERCQDCGGSYDRTIWTAPADLWMNLVGHVSGRLCPPCFDDRAKAAGLFLRWVPQVETS